MRDAIQIGALALIFVFLATRFPETLPFEVRETVETPSFASFVTLSQKDHASLLEAARTSWQVRSEARGRPSIGRLDSGIPLLEDSLPPPSPLAFPRLVQDCTPLGAPTVETYSLVPETRGANIPAFAVKATQQGAKSTAHEAFPTNDMISIDNYPTLKEMTL